MNSKDSNNCIKKKMKEVNASECEPLQINSTNSHKKKKKKDKNKDVNFTDLSEDIKEKDCSEGFNKKKKVSSIKGIDNASCFENDISVTKKKKFNDEDKNFSENEINDESVHIFKKKKKKRKSSPNEFEKSEAVLKSGENSIPEPRIEKYNETTSSKKSKKRHREEIKTNSFQNKNDQNIGRKYTISIAIPASIIGDTNLNNILRTYVVGQLARAACIYSVDEIVVYDDKSNKMHTGKGNIKQCIEMMKMILEYQECPQYLRKHFFQTHQNLQYAGLLNALNAPHHLLANEWLAYREGVVVKENSGRNKLAMVNVGLESSVEVDHSIPVGHRVTVRFPPEVQHMPELYGYVVSPEEPREVAGHYWGYTVRVATSLSEVLKSERFPSGYDVIIGTSDKGDDSSQVLLPVFTHCLIVFGGVQGLESAVASDNHLRGQDVKSVFPYYLNVCPNQTSRTIRTEEAVLITLATLTPRLTSKMKQR